MSEAEIQQLVEMVSVLCGLLVPLLTWTALPGCYTRPGSRRIETV